MEPSQCLTPNPSVLRQCAVVAFCLAFISELAAAAPGTIAQVRSNYDKLPLGFEPNQGQTNAQVKFLSRGNGYTLFLTPSEAVLHLRPREREKNSEAVLRMQMVGANASPRILGKEVLPGLANYLIGEDPASWQTNMPTYGKVAYEGVYPGVDLVYYGNQRQLEYDFVLAPSADPRQVKLAFRGVNNIEVNPAGELILRMANGAIRMRKPVIYQAIDGARKPVDGGYALQTGQTVGFQVAAYDAARPLIIHPILFYSPYLGSTTRWGNEIVVDPQGQAYVTGQSRSPDFPAVNDSQPTFYDDVFIAKLNRQGTALVYSTYLGGTRNDSSSDIAVDPRGQVVVAGTTESFDFPTKNAMHPGGSIFVAQLSADGSELNYSTHLGGKWHDMIRDVAVDQLGQAVVTGSTESPDFPTFNAFQPAVRSYRHSDVFIVRFKANGAPIYSTYLGGDGYDEGYGIAVDSRGQVYVTGVTESYDFPIKNAVQPVFNGFGEFDAFVAKLSADGRTLHYSTYLGGGKDDFGMGIAVDRLGQAYVTGYTYSADFPIKNAVQPVCGDAGDYASNTFVTQLSADGSALRYSTCLERK